jgi:hypothetical protein
LEGIYCPQLRLFLGYKSAFESVFEIDYLSQSLSQPLSQNLSQVLNQIIAEISRYGFNCAPVDSIRRFTHSFDQY